MGDTPETPPQGNPPEGAPPEGAPPEGNPPQGNPPAAPKPEPKGNEPVKLPDDHPLVTAYQRVKDKLKEHEDRDKSDLERATDRAESETARADKAETELARVRAALKHGLSETDLELIGTGTPEEIAARAEQLASRLGDSNRRQPTSTLGGTEEPPTNPDDWLRGAARR